MTDSIHNFKIIAPCDACESQGIVSDRHPNDPSSRDVTCNECEGSGHAEYYELHDSKVDAWADWPKALDIIPI